MLSVTMSYARIRAIEYYLPERTLTNQALEETFPELTADRILAKTGIATRHIAAGDECASDLAEKAANQLFDAGACSRDEIDALVLCTQSPDYFLPTTACLLQTRLGLRTSVAAFDFNLGCSGFVYGLGIAKGMIETGQAKNVLLIMAETYSKHIHPADRSVATLFGDAAAATLLSADETVGGPSIGPFVYGTDGRGAEHLIVRAGGQRMPDAITAADKPGPQNLSMNGPAVFNFTLETVPACVAQLCERAGITPDDVDLFVFHQANAYMLEHLRQKIGIPAEKFAVCIKDCGNTVSATIPIALHDALKKGQLRSGMKVMLVGFGVGLSWGAVMVQW
ncbi:ketoacyl-ACP synthase III [Prosthecobacter sp.]|uniref:3-oxoacyl-ACP synthase III family protein n=1 Tax=Prosthecobacter sp. TaxID=1965333 RepID=UPI002489A670|nr:ketoacyl-ACP synthase III [Prosthecobacter sp.]MDI1310856.1 ketoacyl-ACP synthase III [Prosthecobacter sp.]